MHARALTKPPHGVMNPGKGARFAPGTRAAGVRLIRRFNATAHMRTQWDGAGPVPCKRAKLR
jgi:hypothetical protein